jgi:hypothetical protein
MQPVQALGQVVQLLGGNRLSLRFRAIDADS